MDGLLAEYPWVVRRKLDVHEYRRMGEAGVLGPDDRVELIEGELVAMAPIGSEHAGTTNRMNRFLVRAVGDTALVAIGNPVRLGDHSEPQPDIALLRPRPDDYFASPPVSSDVLLLIEVAASSLRVDRAVKARLYARHGIPEYWIVDVAGRALERHRDPAPEGYRSVDRLGPDAALAPAALPGLSLRVADMLPAAPEG